MSFRGLIALGRNSHCLYYLRFFYYCYFLVSHGYCDKSCDDKWTKLVDWKKLASNSLPGSVFCFLVLFFAVFNWDVIAERNSFKSWHLSSIKYN